MSKKIAISVTEDNIKNGKKGCDNLCPIALALKQKFNIQKKNHISVGSFVWISDENKVAGGSYLHSKNSKLFMDNFDAGLKVKPAKFVLNNLRR